MAGNSTDSPEFISFVNAIAGDSTQCVHCLGPRTEVDQLIANSRLIVLISNYEALPISLIEGLRAGKPIVATDTGDVSSIVRHGVNGYLCSTGDVSQVAFYIHKILDNADLYASMGSASRRLYEDYFSVSTMINRVMSVYSTLL